MRRSITAPLLIILVGCLLLAQNLLADFSIWRLFAQQWPWLLVLAGGLRLLEHALAAARGEAGPAPMRGGALVAAILLCCVGSAAHALDRAFSGGGFAVDWPSFGVLERSHEIPVSGSWPASGAKLLRIENFQGELHVIGDAEDSVRLAGVRRVTEVGADEAREASDARPVRFEVEGETLALRLQGAGGRRLSADLTVHAPRALALALSGGRGALRIESFDAAVSIKTDGSVDLAGVAGGVDIELGRGRRVAARELGADFRLEGSARDVEIDRVAGAVSIEGRVFGDIDLSDVGPLSIRDRRLRLNAPGRLRGTARLDGSDLKLEGLEGDLTLETEGRWEVSLARLGGKATIRGDRGSVDVRLDAEPLSDLTVDLEDGEIRAAVPSAGAYLLDARAPRVDSDLPEVESRRGEPLRLEQGAGGARISLRSARGRVRVAALSPAP